MAKIIAVPVYPPKRNHKMSRLDAIIEDCQAHAVLTNTSFLSDIKEKINNNYLQYITTDNLATNENIKTDFCDFLEINKDDIAFLQYTSGSSGIPKGVMISHGNITHNSEYIKTAVKLTEDSISVTWLPSFHDMGLIDGIIQPLYTGFLGVVMSPEAFLQKPIRWLQAISKYHATHSGSPNFGYELCVEKITPEQLSELDLSSWLSAYNGSEPVRSTTLDKFVNKFSPCGFQSRYFYPCYGMAEATLMISGGELEDELVYLDIREDKLRENLVVEVSNDTQQIKRLVGCGYSSLDTEIIIVNPETQKPCKEKEIGEIWVSGPSVAQGYWRQPETTAETFQAKLADIESKQFLRTGDLGFIAGGELFITGRDKDVIIIRGQNYYPQDVEDTVQNNHVALRKDGGAAFGIEIDDRERLVIVQEIERTYLKKLDLDEIVTAIREAISLNHDLQVYAIELIKPASIPKTSSGKIQRRICRENFLAGTLNSVGTWRQNIVTTDAMSENPPVINKQTITNWLQTKLAGVFGLKIYELDTSTPFSHYGLDSSIALSLTGELGEWLNLKLEPTLFWEYTNITELTEYLEEELENE